MDGFTVVDGVVAVVIVLSAVLAYSRGLVREVMAIAGWVGAAVLAYIFAPAAQPLVKELPMIGAKLAESCELSIIVAYAVVFAIGLIVAALFTPLFSAIIQRSALGGLDQGLGFLFGVLRGIVLIGVAFLVYDRAVASNTFPTVDDSRSAKIFATFQSNIDSAVPNDAPNWLFERFNGLTAICAPTQTDAPAAPAVEGN
jgi:membrane protein required for colicin V production